MKRLSLFLVGIFLFLTTFAQTDIQKYRPGITEEGITYFLPHTLVRVIVYTTKSHYTPGEFCDYAKRYLRLNNVPQHEYDKWNIDKIELYSYGVADDSKAYTIKLNSKTSAPLVTLTPDGRLISINKKIEDYDEELPSDEIIRIEGNQINGNDFKTEEILAAGSKSKMAELTANEIYNIRENRSLLTKGQADFMPKDGEQLRLMLNSLSQQEEGLLQLFKGEKNIEKHTLTFDIDPSKEVEKSILFNFSSYLGLVDNDDPAGIPFHFSIKSVQSLSYSDTVSQNSKGKKEVKDLRYIIPGTISLKIFNDEQEFVSENIPTAQFGRIEHLGGDLFNKKYSTRITLSPKTGGLVQVEAEKPE